MGSYVCGKTGERKTCPVEKAGGDIPKSTFYKKIVNKFTRTYVLFIRKAVSEVVILKALYKLNIRKFL